jgi:PadR family transcriptional regulator, regulatory protein AphA
MPLEHAVLAFLNLQPLSGYDLQKAFEESINHFWSTTQSHIYKVLHDLEENGLAAAQIVEQDGRPDRKVYQITPDGQAELQLWMKSPQALEDVREAWLIQLFFAHNCTNEKITALLQNRIEQAREKIALYQGQVQAGLHKKADELGVERMRLLWQFTLDYGIARYQFEIAWLEQLLARVNALPSLPQSLNTSHAGD